MFRLRPRFGAQSPTVRRGQENGCRAARDLAAVLGVNANTVLRALRVLRDEGLLEFRRGRGVRVAGTPPRAEVVARAHELVRFAREQGYRAEELVRIIEDLA